VVDVNACERWGELSVPTLVVIGERDGDFMRVAPEFLRRLPPNMIRTVRLADAGHAANIEQPAAFESAVFSFASDLGYLNDPPPGRRAGGIGGRTLTAIGAVMVTSGLALLAGSLFMGGGNSNEQPSAASAQQQVAAAATATATPAAVTTVAGTRAAGSGVQPAQPLPTSTPVPVANAIATASPASAATARPTSAPTSTNTPEPTPTPSPAPSPTARATPTGPAAAISGPSTAAIGQTVTLVDTSYPRASVITVKWGGAASAANASVAQASFSAPGCYTVTLTVYFTGLSTPKTASHVINVGGATCGQ
jgi:hypothetical protein